MSHKIINFLPLRCREPTQIEIVLAQHKNEPIPKAKIFETHLEIVESMVEKECSCCSRSAIDDFLDSSLEYSKWIKSMPYLSKVPLINAYRKDVLPRTEFKDCKQEIINHGMIIPKGQILYSGGTFEINDMSYKEYLLSTTLQPSVARWHSCHYSKHIAILTITDNRTYGFVMSRIQGYSQEKEVLLAGKLNLIFKNLLDMGEFKIFEFDLSTK